MTKQCPECKRELEFDKCNFIRSCDGHWRKKCRDCQNKHKRMMYKIKKRNKVKTPDPHREAKKPRLQALIEKYHRILQTLKDLGVSQEATAGYVDEILEAAYRKTAC